MSSEKIKLKPIRRSKGEYEYAKKVLEGVPQGSLVLNKAFGNITAHFHFIGTGASDTITLKSGDKLVLEARKLSGNNTHFGNKGLYKLPIMKCGFVGELKTIDEFEQKCAALDGKKTLYGDD